MDNVLNLHIEGITSEYSGPDSFWDFILQTCGEDPENFDNISETFSGERVDADLSEGLGPFDINWVIDFCKRAKEHGATHIALDPREYGSGELISMKISFNRVSVRSSEEEELLNSFESGGSI